MREIVIEKNEAGQDVYKRQVRGLRAITDFEYELQIAQLNRVMDTSIDTVFLTTSLEYAYLSSSIVKEVAAYGGDISNFVTPYVADEVHKRLR